MATPAIVSRDGIGIDWRMPPTPLDLLKRLATKVGAKVTTGAGQPTQVK